MNRILTLIALAATAIVATTGPADAAATSTTISHGYAGYVPCANGGAGELVTGTVQTHLLDASTTTGAGDASHFLMGTRGRLVGTVSGDVYTLAGTMHGTSVSSGENGVTTYVSSYRLIGRGGASDLVVRETAHTTRHGDEVVVERFTFGIECA